MEVVFSDVARENEILGTIQVKTYMDAKLLCIVINTATSWVYAEISPAGKPPPRKVAKKQAPIVPITFWSILNEPRVLGTMHLSCDDARAIAGAINSDSSTLWATLENEPVPEDAMDLKEVRGM